ncbi:hypothetical protein ELR76_22405 [Salmonella enterica subsp. enterica serovar Menston]|nr:hypothetical protein [Salmonella enterica subsp. enterica serovar Menston]ECF2224034.1 hypothetical protein [Salmonella enterica subsp. enterica serovar Tyresoe]EDD8385246.1 hypothetical protein [Salmonella enterica subsp. enterica serovar Schwarzengrund]
MNKSKDDIILDIDKVIRPLLEKKGFSRKKNYFELDDNVGNTYQYEIILSKNKGHFALHLRLKLLNKSLMKEVNKLLEKALLDKDYSYPNNWEERDIKTSIKTRISNFCLAMVTDWRCFKEQSETLENFRKRFSIWMCVFDDINEIDSWKDQLIESLNFAEKWFLSIGSHQWIIDNTLYPAMYILKKEEKIIELNNKYKDVLAKIKSKNEAELFFKYLNML